MIACGLILLWAPSGPAQDIPKTPTFGADTKLVLVDFVVKEDGQVRPIVSFVAFNGGAPAGGAGPAEVVVEPFPSAAPPPVAGSPDTITVLFIDEGQTSPQEAFRLRPGVKALINAIAERNGVLALIAPWSKITLTEEAQGNKALFGAAVDKIVGRRLEGLSMFPMSDAEAIAIERGDPWILARLARRFALLNPGFGLDQAAMVAHGRAIEVARDARVLREDAYEVLLQSLDWLAKQPGRHSVVMVSGGFAYDSDDSKPQEVVTRSLRANAPIHFIDARGLQGLGRFQGAEFGPGLDRDAGETPFAFAEAAEGSTNLASDTGGLIIRNVNDIAKGLARVLDTMTTYYLIGYQPPEHKKPGFRKIKVEVLTKGLKVVARRGYFDEGSTAP